MALGDRRLMTLRCPEPVRIPEWAWQQSAESGRLGWCFAEMCLTRGGLLRRDEIGLPVITATTADILQQIRSLSAILRLRIIDRFPTSVWA